MRRLAEPLGRRFGRHGRTGGRSRRPTSLGHGETAGSHNRHPYPPACQNRSQRVPAVAGGNQTPRYPSVRSELAQIAIQPRNRYYRIYCPQVSWPHRVAFQDITDRTHCTSGSFSIQPSHANRGRPCQCAHHDAFAGARLRRPRAEAGIKCGSATAAGRHRPPVRNRRRVRSYDCHCFIGFFLFSSIRCLDRLDLWRSLNLKAGRVCRQDAIRPPGE